ncbi:Serine/threonine-protein kinase pim-3 [Triplophysa tibetana]|uniref:non-specific serine/threonine protein kinase n=1 Tax=Triplophysa tibetana TaxID=1572043 RepID=A0A5A9N5P4_9TELE|nr:Serine/threonine-protein kinase pim-3 [Triplophysa tibetana]
MGQKFGKGVESDGVVDRSGVHDKCTRSPDWERDEGDLFWTWSATPAIESINSLVNRESVEEVDLFWPSGSNKVQVESCEGEAEEVDLFWTSRTTPDEERPPVTDVTLVADPAEDEMSGQAVTPECQENPETLSGDLEMLTSQDPLAHVENPVLSDSQMHLGLDLNSSVQDPVPIEADREAEIQETSDDEISGQAVTPECQENPETLSGDLEILTSQDPLAHVENPVLSDSQMHLGLDLNSSVQDPVPIEADREAEIQETSDGQSEEKLEEDEISGVIFQEINSTMYEIGELLAVDGSVAVFEGTRVQDNLKVVVKYLYTTERVDYISIPGYPEPLPRQVGLHMLACQGDDVPELVQLVDWQEYPDRFVMVLERPSTFEALDVFVASKGGELDELSAREIMWQATWAAHVCCQRRVFHRDINMKNLFIKADTLALKLDNFGCGDLLQKSAYTSFTGTRDYVCPEFLLTGEYYGRPATVYSLGVLLFAMLCGKFPDCNDRNLIRYKDGLTEGEIFIRATVDRNKNDLIKELNKMMNESKYDIQINSRFKVKDPSDGLQTPVHSENDDVIQYQDDAGSDVHVEWISEMEMEEKDPSVVIQEINRNQYELGRMLGEGGFGKVYDGIRVHDGLKVAVKIVGKNEYVIDDYIDIPDYPELVPREVGLQMLACKGKSVPTIIQFLDWEDRLDQYVMVLERPSPCTDIYLGPEYFLTGEYYGKPATVYSLGMVLFVMLCGKFPSLDDLDQIDERRWCKDGLTKECCRLVEDCLEKNPDKRIHLERIRYHEWFQDKYRRDGLQSPVRPGGDDVVGNPDDAGSNILIIRTSNGQSEVKLEGAENPGVSIQEINCCQYEIGPMLGEGGYGKVYEGTRVRDGLKPGYLEPLPREVYLQMLACGGTSVPTIIQFLDWEDRLDRYVMVMERPSPCTRFYACPEFLNTGEYHGKPATVYSLGIVLFTLVCGKYPNRNDRHRINEKIWHKEGLTEQCCDLIQACMRTNPEERIRLEEIFDHKSESYSNVTDRTSGVRNNRGVFQIMSVPSAVRGLRCGYSWTNKAVILVWDHPNVEESMYHFEVQVNGRSPKIVNDTWDQIADVPSVGYFDISITSIYGCRRSDPMSIRCETKLKGVIVGSVAAVSGLFIICVLSCREVFIKLRSFKRSSREVVVQTTNQTVFINDSSINTQENVYEDLDESTRVQAPYEICRLPRCFKGPSVQGINISDVVVYEN